jgi:GMP synthase-like glutamine amidotransferase
MRVLILQHDRLAHAGSFARFLDEDGHQRATVELDEGEALPPLDGFDALWVMGGPMDVWQQDLHPWLAEEKAFIREAVARRGLPFFGICLGHQLLGEALGGHVGLAAQQEVGVMPVRLSEAESVPFDGLPDAFDCLQWHHAEVTGLPDGAVALASSPACAVQAMQWGTRALSIQFHAEIEPGMIGPWTSAPPYVAALEAAVGPDGPVRLRDACTASVDGFVARAERLYINWLQLAAAR